MLVVLAIIGILTSVGVPSYNKFVEQGQFAKAYNNLNNAYRFARAEALKTSSPMEMHYITGGWWSGWKVYPQGDAGNPILTTPPIDINVTLLGPDVVVLGNGSLIASTKFRLDDPRNSTTIYFCLLKNGQSYKSTSNCP